MIKIKPSLEIGDKVRIVDDGWRYPTYAAMVVAMIEYYSLDKEIMGCWLKGSFAKNGDEGYIMATSEHENGEAYLALISVDDGYILIALNGLELVERRNLKERLL